MGDLPSPRQHAARGRPIAVAILLIAGRGGAAAVPGAPFTINLDTEHPSLVPPDKAGRLLVLPVRAPIQ